VSPTARRRGVVILGIVLSLIAAIQALHRAGQGRAAYLRWAPDAEAFWSGDALYGVGAEGYPTLPLSLLLMSPFRVLGEVPGAFAWALFKIGLAWWIVTRAFALVGRGGAGLGAAGKVAVILLSFRPLLSDVTHGNLNLVVGATVVAGAWAWQRERDLRAGAWLGIGAALKVTPALGLLFLLHQRSWRGVCGLGLGAAVGVLLPALFVGWERNLELAAAWWQQMAAPYLEGRPLGLPQTEHTNQSLLGVLGRLLTDSVAIPGRGEGAADLSVSLLHLGSGGFRVVHLAACGAVLAFLWACLAPARRPRVGPWTLGGFALLALAMLFLSERSWKHHYVLLVLPITYLVAQLRGARDGPAFRLALAGLVAAALSVGATGSGLLGGRGSDLAEAYGCYLVGGLALFVAVGLLLRSDGRRHQEGESSPSRIASRASSAAE